MNPLGNMCFGGGNWFLGIFLLLTGFVRKPGNIKGVGPGIVWAWGLCWTKLEAGSGVVLYF